MNPEPLAPGATIGILGGGQLGRMIALAAARLGFRTHVFCPDPASPAFDVASRRTDAAYEDEAALAAFAADVDVATYEFENVPAGTAAFLAARRTLRPDAAALRTTQDRLEEKRFLDRIGVPVAPWAPVDGPGDVDAAIAAAGLPGVLKTRRFGYDGKGQAKVADRAGFVAAVGALGGRDLVYEGFVDFVMEISAIVVRGANGAFGVYDVGENLHENHILRRTTVPARVPDTTRGTAAALAIRIAERLGYVGVMGVEMFVVDDPTGQRGAQRLLVNELAPRVHNSGHWTEDGAVTGQFENHVRAIAGWPLGSTQRLGEVTMTNLIGAEADDWLSIVADPGARLHLYGKAEARPGRKMGHVNRVVPPAG
jgi:5-(carboxyamino)imidazole ribonucleotide synthase